MLLREVVVLRPCGAAQRGRKSSVEGRRRNFKWVLGKKMELAVPGNEDRDAMGEPLPQSHRLSQAWEN